MWSSKFTRSTIKKVKGFKYLGSTIQNNGDCNHEVKRRVQAGWNGWRMATGITCENKISVRMKGKKYKMLVKPAMLWTGDSSTNKKTGSRAGGR